MPDENWKLTQKEKEDVVAWIKEKWENTKCPFSGHNEWNLGDELVRTTKYTGNNLLIGGSTYPLIIFTCIGCGYVVYINAILVGIVPKEEKAPPEKKEEADASTESSS